MDTSDDSSLAARAKQGDWNALEELIFRYSDKIYSFAYFYIRNREDARDISQETFFRLYKGIRRYDPGRPFFSWFYSLFLNTVRDFGKRKKRTAFIGDNELDDLIWSGKEEISSEEKICLLQAMDLLEEDDRTLLVIHYFQGVGLQELSEQLGITGNNAGVRLHRAKECLKKMLKDMAYEL